MIKFKAFVNQYPKMREEVRMGTVTWQELFEDWYLLGEADKRWDVFKAGPGNLNTNQALDDEKKSDWMTTVFGYLKTMDMDQIQQHINHVSQALGAVQGVISQFQTPSQPNKRNQSGQSSHPFSFRKD